MKGWTYRTIVVEGVTGKYVVRRDVNFLLTVETFCLSGIIINFLKNKKICYDFKYLPKDTIVTFWMGWLISVVGVEDEKFFSSVETFRLSKIIKNLLKI